LRVQELREEAILIDRRLTVDIDSSPQIAAIVPNIADLKRGILTIPRSKHGELRHIQLNSVARAALLKLRAHGDGVGYVCPGLEGPPNRDWRRWFEEVARIAEIHNFRWHDCGTPLPAA